MRFTHIVRWLESVSSLAAGILGLFFLRYFLLTLNGPAHFAPDANAPLRTGLLIADLLLLAIAVGSALVHSWVNKPVGRIFLWLLWGCAIPLIVLAVLSGNLAGWSLLPAALLVLLASVLAVLWIPSA
ncbi:MAG: hypothetical protein OJF49_000936 [Ktedonobacterales bacterium]|jgi:hypothetical protein|nr:MAG: hypothetical protein OJF49_000936 [Ktedonobacterales bacterium]